MTTAVRTDLGQLRGDVRIAARVLAPNWPLGRFIAVNPLGGFEDRPFPEAVAEAAGWFGSAGTPSESIMRAAFREGRIERHELVSALRDHCPGLLAGPPLAVGGELLSPERLLVEDLLGGEPAPAPVRTRLTLAEATMPDAAELIDSQCGKWMAAFLDRGQARWAMPGRERGFYAAWRALAVHDPALPRAARALLGRLPERADAALADALDRLGIPAGHRREYLRRHLTALPGWAAHVRWHAEHGQGLDLVDYLAMRVSYESALLDGGDSGAVDALWEPATGPDLVPGAERALQAFAGLPHLDPTEAELAAAAALLNRFPASDRPLDLARRLRGGTTATGSWPRWRRTGQAPRQPGPPRSSSAASTPARKVCGGTSRLPGRTRRSASPGSSPSRFGSRRSRRPSLAISARCCSSHATP
ncbi:MAG: putative inorganic carbon transporter subunit DabA [Baekduia sp.]